MSHSQFGEPRNFGVQVGFKFGGDDAPSLVVAKAYTPEAFRRLMRTGEVAAGGKSKTGFMSEVAAYRFSVMTDAEVAALKAYLDAR